MKRFFIIIMLFALVAPAMAKEKEGVEDKPRVANKRLKARCENTTARADLDINNVRARIMNGGDMWWDLVGAARYEVPIVPDGSNEPRRHALFAGSIWIGGLFNGNIHNAAQTYRQFGGNDFWAGPLDTVANAIDDTDCQYWDKIFQVTREEIDAFVAEFEESGSVVDIPNNIAEWPGNGRADENEARFLAPYVNVGGGPGYDPSAGDYPDIKGDKALWYVYNDMGNLKTETQSPEIGLEFRTMAFGFATNDEINNMTFYETTIYNRGQKQLDSTYFGQWVDADLGFAFDDYVGCDTVRGLGICFNGDNFDDGAFGYGANPPSVGVDFFEGPLADLEVIFPGGNGDGRDNDGDGLVDELDSTYFDYFRNNPDFDELPIIYEGDGSDNNRDGQVDEPGEDITMQKFVYYDNNFSVTGNPSANQHFYNYLIGRWKNGDCIRYGGNGFTTATGGCTDYMFPDDPRDPDGWTEVSSNNQPFDRRFLQSAGPFTLKPGAVNTVTIGVVWARASSGGNTGSYDLLLLADDKAQKLFNNNFDLLDGPDAPGLSAVELDKEVILMMDREDYIETESYVDQEITTEGNEVDYTFQGYQLYQILNSQITPDQLDNPDLAREIWQADIRDGVSVLVNREFSPEVSASIPSVMVDGNDEGLEHVIRITEDAFASGESQLINHKTYHYILVAYAAVDNDNTDEDRQYLGGRRITRVSVTPMETKVLFDGTELNASYGDSPEMTRIEGKGNGGQFLRLTDATVESILENNVNSKPTYQVASGPVQVKVIDPLRIPVADYELRFEDAPIEGTTGEDLLADISSRRSTYNDRLAEFNLQREVRNDVEQDQNDAIGKLLSTERRLQTAEDTIQSGNISEEDSIYYASLVNVLEREIEEYKSDTTELGIDLADAQDELDRLNNRLQNSKDNLDESLARADSVIWELKKINSDGTEEIRRAEKPLYTDNEMVIDEWGFSITAGPEYGPLGSSDDQTNGLLGSELVYENDAVEWLSALPQFENNSDAQPSIFDWIRAGNNFPSGEEPIPAVHDADYDNIDGSGHMDSKGVYKEVVDGMIAPYVLTSRSTELNGISTFGICQAPSYGLECENFLTLPSIDLVFTSDRSKWSRVLVCEMGEDPNRTEGGAEKFMIRQHPSLELEPDADGNPVYSNSSVGYSWFPGYAIDVETGERLNIIIGENSLLEPSYAKDMIWNPTSKLFDNNIPTVLDGGVIQGGMHNIYVMASISAYEIGNQGGYATTYDGCESYYRFLDPNSTDATTIKTRGVWSSAAWVMPAMLAEGYALRSWEDGIVPTETRISIRINRPYQTFATSENPENDNLPFYKFSTASVAPTYNDSIGTEELNSVRVVPNPYYAQSTYERLQTDNFVKITNLPRKCRIKVFTVNGQLVKEFVKDESTDNHNTELLWNLKNDAEVPIASGVYIIHVDARELGLGMSTTKFFAVMKPIDLDTF